ncbi:MAG: hypothetical protein AAFV80_03790 [Bacteroidota bacterium]
MSDLQRHIETMYAYWEGRLTDSERAALRKEMEDNPKLAAAYETYQVIFAGFRQMRSENFEERVHFWEADLEERETRSEAEHSEAYRKSMELTTTGLEVIPALQMEQKIKNWESTAQEAPQKTENVSGRTKVRRLMVRFAVAATIVLVGYWSFSFWAHQNWSDPAYALAEMELPSGLRSTEDVQPQIVQAISAALLAQDYPTAIELAQTVNKADSLYPKTQYLAGHAFFREGSYIAAARAFNSVRLIPDQPNINYELTDYQLYLSFLAAEDYDGIEAAKAIILDRKGHAYQDEVQAMEAKRSRVVRLLFVN